MSHVPLLADPGVGRKNAAPGTMDWARHVRLVLQGLVDDIPKAPESVRRYVDGIIKYRAWTLMNKPDGSCFATFEEFCAFRQPWGLGRSWEELRRVLEVALGKRGLDLATVAPDGRRENGDNRDTGAARFVAQTPKTSRNTDSGHGGPNQYFSTSCGEPSPGDRELERRSPGSIASLEHDVQKPSESPTPQAGRHAKRLRAILRAPEAVQGLYRDGLIGQDEAARLGPKEADAETAAKLHEVVQATVAFAKADSGPKAAVQKRVNAFVRERLGRPEREERRARLARLVDKLDGEDRRWLAAYVAERKEGTARCP